MTLVIKGNGTRALEFDANRLRNKLDVFKEGLNIDDKSFSRYKDSVVAQIEATDDIDFRQINDIAIQNANDYIIDIYEEEKVLDPSKIGNVQFEFVAGRILLNSLYKRASKNRSYDKSDKYGSYYGLLLSLGEKGLIDERLFIHYTPEELKEAGEFIKPERDYLLTYSGVHNISERYLIRDKDETRSVYELPQERYLTIALTISMLEKNNKMEIVKDLYNALSEQKITMATPTYMNAGRPDGQYSSCFVLTTEDSLRGIYDDNTDAATLSKFGGGIGLYAGGLRARGSDIRGNKNASSGIIGWLKQLNNTAVSVNQLGVRSGAIAVYLDVWHSDIEDFLELRLNTGDLNKRAHELFTGLCIPDLFMEQVDKRGDWVLFDPHEIETVMGYKLQDFYDKVKWDGKSDPDKDLNAFTYHYFKAVDSNDLKSKKRIPAISLMKKVMKAQLETGLPYMFYRDTVNRENPNNQAGMIYCSNLCSEICENQSPTKVISEFLNKETGEVIVRKQAGDFVVCNLSSTVLNNVLHGYNMFDTKEKEAAYTELKHIMKVQVRATDNVIRINNLPVPQAEYTNNKYRAIGLGEQGIAATLAEQNISFDSHEATKFIADLEKHIMLFSIEASADLAQEKGSYPVFEGSKWQTGEWLAERGITEESGSEYEKEVLRKSKLGMANAYLRAVAPTGSTSLLAGSTAAADTVYDTIFFDGKKDSRTPVVAPRLDLNTWFYYKPTMLMEYEGTRDLGQMWAILHNEARQLWVDQATSFNLYILDDISAINLLRLHQEVWGRGIKTSYYTRSHDASRIESCVACSS